MRTRFPRARLALVLCSSALLFTSCGGKSMPEAASSVVSDAAPLLGPIAAAIPGLSEAQAILGAGSLLGLAEQKMPDEQFDKVEDAVPGTKGLINEAVAKGLPKTLGGLADVTSFLGKAGITPDQVAQLVPVVGNAVKGKVPDDVANAFVAALQ